MRRFYSLTVVMVAMVVLNACGGTDVVVQAQLDRVSEADTTSAESGPTPLTGMEVWLLPYDRDAIFDSLAAVADEPEPAIPDSLMQLQDRIAEAAVVNQQATARWNTVRDSLQTLSEELDGLSRASAEYRVLFREFSELESRVNELQATMDSTFEVFTQLQRRFATQAEEISLARAQWEDEAFRSVDSIMLARAEEMGREELVDTTNANGIARFSNVPGGQWWVHARYELPYDELYWNEPTQVEGDQVSVTLDRQSAEVRPNL